MPNPPNDRQDAYPPNDRQDAYPPQGNEKPPWALRPKGA